MPKFVNIDAKPEPMRIDLARTAVIVVDMQNDFGAEGGMFARAGINIEPIRKSSNRRRRCSPPPGARA